MIKLNWARLGLSHINYISKIIVVLESNTARGATANHKAKPYRRLVNVDKICKQQHWCALTNIMYVIGAIYMIRYLLF